jgi:SAM-dependent methyltransferase
LDEITRGVAAYYTRTLEQFGPTPRGVDWNSEEAQDIRFSALLSVCREVPYSLLDFGCGYGALAERVMATGACTRYDGFDIAPAMVAQARALHAAPGLTFHDDLASVPQADYTVASGIFSVKGGVPDDAWLTYIYETIDRLAEHSGKGFSFNALTAYSDPEKMRPDLYYADPHALFERVYRRYSRHVALVHDYGLYEFTIRVRLD